MISTPETRARAAAVLEKIESDPASHNQMAYGHMTECGTTCCIAGWTLVMFAPEKVEWKTAAGATYMVPKGHDGMYLGSLSTMAGELLGLNEEEQETIFAEFNKAHALKLLKHVSVGDEIVNDEGHSLFPSLDGD